ncbi:MAG: HAMP domain-containing histidine kinase [Lachnospiraceae bacterium]|nr:HAMP domain-containing histidine kinase [Lachnospiraceae bacterium]
MAAKEHASFAEMCMLSFVLAESAKLHRDFACERGMVMKRLTIRLRITLWYSAILILAVALAYFVVLFSSRQILQKTIQDSLVYAVEDNLNAVRYYSSLSSEESERNVLYYLRYGDGYIEVDDDFLNEVNDIFTSLCESDGTLLYGENPIILNTAALEMQDSQIQRVKVNGTLYYVYDRQLEGEGLEGLWLRGVVSETQGELEWSAIFRISLLLLPGLVLVAIIGGWLIARRALAPVRQISDTAAQIRQGDELKKRIEIGEGKDALHQLSGQFNAMFARPEESFPTQQQIFSDASHELRTPVSVITAQCEYTLEEARTPEEYEEALTVIRRQSRKLSHLISDMLDFARLEMQPERYRKETFDLAALTRDICQDMALIRDKGITLTCEAREKIDICGSQELMTRLLTNLISNAYRYGREDGHIWVSVHTQNADHRVILSVKDDGIGISEEELSRIFERFYQADPSRSGRGNGLGLAMAKEIAAFHGGELSVKSEPGKGSTFSFILCIKKSF